MGGVQCPQCKGYRTGCKNAGYDGAGNRIRVRVCKNCGYRGNTVEAWADFVFNRMDVSKVERDRARNARRIAPEHEPKDFVPSSRGLGRLHVTVVAIEIPRSNKCRRGLHLLTPDNAYVNTTTGHRKCRACARAAAAVYREQNRDRLRASRRASEARRRARDKQAREQAA